MNGKFVWHSPVAAGLCALGILSLAAPVRAQSESHMIVRADSAALSRVGGGRIISLMPHQTGQEVWLSIEVMHGNQLMDVVVNPRTDAVLSVRTLS